MTTPAAQNAEIPQISDDDADGTLSNADNAGDDDEAPSDALRKARNEAKNLRARLRAKEADYEKLSTQLAAAQRRDAERVAAETLVDPQDLWLHTDAETQQSFVDEEFGAIAADNVVAAAKRVIAQRPHLAKPQAIRPPTDRPLESLRSGAMPAEEKKPTPSWHTALRGG